jgi:hypothetical protein
MYKSYREVQLSARNDRVNMARVGLRAFGWMGGPRSRKARAGAAFIISTPGPSPGNPTVGWPACGSACKQREHVRRVRIDAALGRVLVVSVAGFVRDVSHRVIWPPGRPDDKTMPNERPRTAMLERGITPAEMAEEELWTTN